MLVEELIKLVNARGVNFQYVAGNASNTKGQAKKRVLSPAERKLRKELHVSLDIQETSKGGGSRVARKGAWSHAELAHAMVGVPRMPELALYYSLAGWLGAFEELHRGLMVKLLQSMDDSWPMIVPYTAKRVGDPYDYVPKLATIVLVQEAHKNEFIIAPHLPAHYLGMDAAHWEKHLLGRYLQLQRDYESWYQLAMGNIRRALMRRSEQPRAAESLTVTA